VLGELLHVLGRKLPLGGKLQLLAGLLQGSALPVVLAASAYFLWLMERVQCQLWLTHRVTHGDHLQQRLLQLFDGNVSRHRFLLHGDAGVPYRRVPRYQLWELEQL
jgi:hypothetical protein